MFQDDREPTEVGTTMNAEQPRQPDPSSNRDWIEQELGEVSLGDARLDRRLLETGSRMADQPTATNPQRLDWNELRGFYRVVHAPRAQFHILHLIAASRANG